MNEDDPSIQPAASEPAASRPPRVRVPREKTPAGERAIEAAILSHTLAAGDGSVTPVDVAMALGADWRSKLTAVRRAAINLALDGHIEILRKGKPVDPIGVKGVIRLRAAPKPPESPLPEQATSHEMS